MAATKKQTNRKGTGRSSSGRKNTKKKTTAKQSLTSGFPCVSVSDSDLRMCGISGFEPQESTGIQKGACGTAVLYLSVWTDPASDGRIYAKYDTG